MERQHGVALRRAAETAAARPHSLGRLLWIMAITAFLGALVETVFMLVTRGRLMNRSGLLYGQFSLVWGLGAVVFTITLRRLVKRGPVLTFLAGAVIGSAFEFLCSVVQEKCFGLVFWDYSHLPLSIGGRVNLVFALFWGAAAAVWMYVALPRLDSFLDRAPAALRRPMTAALCVFLILDVLLTACALTRLNARQDGVEALNPFELFLDRCYPDQRLFERFTDMRHIKEYRIEHPDFR